MPHTRREFLTTSASTAALASASAAAAPAAMPTLRLGKLEISRLVMGSNPFSGGSHFNPILDRFMREFYTPEKVLEVLSNAEKAGITGWQLHEDPKLLDALVRHREQGGKLQAFILSAYKDGVGSVATFARLPCFGLVHHGERTDIMFREGKMEPVHEFIKATRDAGKMAGVSTHNPAVVDYIEGKGWDPDFYMTCVYRRNRTPEEQRAEFNEATVNEPYFEKDPERMCRMVRQTKKTCFAFKILAAGRAIRSPAAIEGQFRFALQNIKPNDGVIVGMFPRYKDEIGENAALTRKYGSGQRQG
jgi:hypothetical protein